MAQLGSLQYVMQLSGPPKKAPVGLLGTFDPYVAHPWLLVLGIAGGIFLATRKRRRR